jgi:hypothetical protein
LKAENEAKEKKAKETEIKALSYNYLFILAIDILQTSKKI